MTMAIDFKISIHSLRMEGDSFHNFRFRHKKISIHSLRMEGDTDAANIRLSTKTFQSTPSAWRETETPVRKI